MKWSDIICEAASSVPTVLYHATYQPHVRQIISQGLHGENPQKNHDDSRLGLVYLAVSPEIAASHAEGSDTVPDDWLDQIVVLRVTTAGLDPTRLHADSNVIGDGGTYEYAGTIAPRFIEVV